MSNTAEFRISYDGPALETHEMDVRELAPALIALNDTLEEINNEINNGHTEISIKVKGTFKTGSFPIDLTVYQHLLPLLNFLGSQPMAGAMNLITLIILLGELIKWVNNRRIKSVIQIDDKTEIQIGEEKKLWPSQVFDLFKNYKVRQGFENFIAKPLSKEGMTSVEFKVREDNPFRITSDEALAFWAPVPEDEFLSENTYEATLQIVNAAFQEGNKWRFTDGAASFFAIIKDNNFIDKVQSSKAHFSKDDILKVKLRKIQFESLDGIKTEYEVVEVLNHRKPGGLQLKMNLPKEDL